jgi:succinate dehydrogenase / fumarate reductase cytochrome b subunit
MGFLGAHIVLARIKPALRADGTGHEDFCDLAGHMRHHPPTLTVYTLGVIGMAYHLANGVYTAAFINGLAVSPKASKQMQVASLALFALLLVFGLGSVIGMYTQATAFNCPVPPT